MIYVVLIFLVLAGILAGVSNSDIFSPAKFYLFFFAMFHAGAFWSDIGTLTAVLIFLVLCVGIVIVVYEANAMQRFAGRAMTGWGSVMRVAPRIAPARDYTIFLWVISIPSVFAQFYMIRHFGGIEGYVNSVGLRVIEWAGFGWARVLINLLAPINLVYFALGLRKKRSLQWWGIYVAHLLIIILMGLLSGSRSSALSIFAFLTIIYHYLRAPISGRTATVLALGLIFAALTLGVVRNGARFDQGQFVAGSWERQQSASLSSFNSGVQSLEIIASAPFTPLAHGSTFMSLLTNAVPRAWWPDKPETGGVFFTKYYTGDAWYGFSNLTPTFLGEWIINFGFIGGIIGYALVYSLMLIALIRTYKRLVTLLVFERSDTLTIDVVIYVQVIWGLLALMVGETTNILLNMLTTQLIPLALIRFYIARRSRA